MRDGTTQRRRALYLEAVDLIERDYAHELNLDGVAHSLATSRRQLQRAFAEVGDTSFRDVLAAVRMSHARRLLVQEPVPVRNIAARVGYQQPAQFAKSFRRHHGTAPSAFRKRERLDHAGPRAEGAVQAA